MTADEMRAMGRYPHTYAYDWVRMIVGADVSRGDCVPLVEKHAASIGMDRMELIHALADQYVEHFSALEAIETRGRDQRASWGFIP